MCGSKLFHKVRFDVEVTFFSSNEQRGNARDDKKWNAAVENNKKEVVVKNSNKSNNRNRIKYREIGYVRIHNNDVTNARLLQQDALESISMCFNPELGRFRS